MAASPPASINTIALADQLNHLRQRVPLAESDVSRTTGADTETVHAWSGRTAAPTGEGANRLLELMAVVDEMALNIRADSIQALLEGQLPVLDGQAPADVIAAGGYDRVMILAVGLSQGTFGEDPPGLPSRTRRTTSSGFTPSGSLSAWQLSEAFAHRPYT